MSRPALGARWSAGRGVAFALAAPAAEGVEVALFAGPEPGTIETGRRAAAPDGGGIWRLEAPDLEPGQAYGFRVDGPGPEFDPDKLLVDPYALAVGGEPVWGEALAPGARGDTAALVPRSIVVGDGFDWGDDRRPRRPWSETVIYECHVRGMTRLHPAVPPALRGTYLGLAAEPVVEHLLALGVTAVELLPVQQHASERHLVERGMTNYWGYSPIAFFAPHAAYAASAGGGQVEEFRRMVRALHAAGLEVLLDVVFNHTAEGDADGLVLGPRGIDAAAYYRIEDGHWIDWTGCGNTLDASSPVVRDLVLDCLRYWVEEMRVDGFRFDLGTALGRDADGRFDPAGSLLADIAADPVIASVKLVAEPWDLGPGGYRAGEFPEPFREWNDRFRKAARGFWRGDAGAAGELCRRFAGSPDLYAGRASGALAGVNYVTAHDGFTLADLVSYARKHNEANGEANRDGSDHELSSNWGVEGPSDDPAIRRLRLAARKNLLATLALAPGVPMLAHGDELGRSQRGNNNAYCQDNELAWVDWSPPAAEDRELLGLLRAALALRRSLRLGAASSLDALGQGRWLDAGGRGLGEPKSAAPRPLALLRAGTPAGGTSLLTLLNPTPEPVRFTLPPPANGRAWRLLLATAGEAGAAAAAAELPPWSLALLAAEATEAR